MTPRDTAIKRLKMRSMRRGIKEMDLILTDFAARRLDGMSDSDIAEYDALLNENDQDIYGWILGLAPPPDRFDALIATLRDGAEGVARRDDGRPATG